MSVSRRNIVLGLGALGLAACQGGVTGPVGVSPAASNWPTTPNAGFDAWVGAFRARATAKGVSDATLNAAFRGAGFIPSVVDRDRNQFQRRRSLEDYLAIAASDERVTKGRAALTRNASLLGQIEMRYGVPKQVVAAIWGMESKFGERRGDVPVISALATLAYDGRRASFFENQLIAALQILQAGDVSPRNMRGSWAGAMGHTQFIPTTFRAYAVDFTGDGRRDIWGDDPTDALASTAAYLKASGWKAGQPWGTEVTLPGDFAGGLGRGTKRTSAQWAALGVRNAGGGSLPNAGEGSILRLQAPGTPAFLVFKNFNVILRYNNSEKYGLGIGHLSDRISGTAGLRGDFGPDEHGLTLAGRKDLQRRLGQKGFDAGSPDGVVGDKTTAAVRAYQQARGLPVDGIASAALLRHLRA